MGTRFGRQASKGGAATLLLILSVLAVSLPACQKSAGPETPPPATLPVTGVSEPVRSEPQSDPALDRLFAGIAGIAEPRSVQAARPDDEAWKAFAKSVNGEWGQFDASVLKPMASWAEVELKEARKETLSLFYPFGGPDSVTSLTLFPNVRETVLLGLEQVGNLPDLEGAAPDWREAFFADMGGLISEFCKRGYFITKDMTDVYGRGKVDGALPVIAFFMARGGYSIVSVTRLAPDEQGGWTETPYKHMATRPRRPYGARITFLKPGDAERHSIVYFSCDIENKAFPVDSPLYRYFAGLDRMTTFVKSGSYLLQYADFSILRDLILDRSLFVLQDDTAVPYKYLKSGGWEIKLFGKYAAPIKDFSSNVEQPDLKQAYEAGGSAVAPLPFKFGYHWRTQINNLLLAKRPQRPASSAVVR